MPATFPSCAVATTRRQALCLQRAFAAIILICCGAVLPGAARACGPVPGGPPAACAPGSPASLGTSGGVEAGAGNPINVITGNKYQREEDLPALPGVLGLEIVRHYNSAYSKPGGPAGPMGRAWKLSYETELVDQAGKLQILQADGSRAIFDRDPRNPNLCSTALPANGQLTIGRQANGMSDYTWQWPNGRRLHFNHGGKLDRITAPSGEAVSLQYDAEQVLVAVTDPQGRSLRLGYPDRKMTSAGERFRGVQYIDSPVGRYSYEYGSAVPAGGSPFDARLLQANITRVRLPTSYDAGNPAHPLAKQGTPSSAVSRIYHYENARLPWLLTGISVETAGPDGKARTSRFATFGYDDNGLANLSTHAGNVDKVMLDTRVGGKTVLTNSLGQQTVYRHAIVGNEHRILEVRGAGCSTCGETNVRYGYDRLGQLVEAIKLNVNGEPIRAVRRKLDQLGRLVTLSKVDYQGGKPGTEAWQLRMEYQGADSAPTLVATPSVVPGKERQTRIIYNSAGQPLSVSDTGWIPTYDGQHAAAQITRTTLYQYASIHGRSLLTRIDGPLPNGKTNSPLDSDVTVFEYDNRPDNEPTRSGAAQVGKLPGKLAGYDERLAQRDGVLTRIIAPGNLVTTVLERDAALRPAKLRITDGDLVQLASVRSNWRGQPEDIVLSGGALRRHLQYDYDTDGRILAVIRPGNQRSTVEYDPAGRPSRLILPDGSGIAMRHDTEDHAATIARYTDMTAAPAQALSSLRFDYGRDADQPSRLASMADALGPITRYQYNDIGQVIAISNAIGTSATFEYEANGRLASRTDAAGSADAASLGLAYDPAGHAIRVTAPNGVNTLRRYDDFGLKVFEADPDRGVALFRYDAAGRLAVRIDETNAATRYTYDNAGRLRAVGKDKLANLLQYQYRGSRLTNMLSTTDGNPAHATERLDYQYDALGQMTKEARWLADVSQPASANANPTSKGLLFVTHYEYDEAGRLVRQILPDGHSLRYRYAPDRDTMQDAKAQHRSGQLEAILFDEQVVVRDITQTIAGGLTGYTMSNGARQQIELDRRGRIAQLRTVATATSPQRSWWRQIAAWFSNGSESGNAPLYQQVNRYDAADRLVQIDKQMVAADPGQKASMQHARYAYDSMDRLTGISASAEADTTYRYDRAGNRLGESHAPLSGAQVDTSPGASRLLQRGFHYSPGGNWLLATTQAATSGALAPTVQNAWLYHATGLPLAQLRWQTGNATNRRIVYNTDKRPIAVYENHQLVVRYHYNSLGERVAKTVYPSQAPIVSVALAKTAPDVTRYALYRNQRLAAETDSSGRIAAHYIYLYGKPVAKIEMTENTAFTHRLWKAITLRSEDRPSDRLPQLYAIITDHLGTPQQVLNDQQQPVWQATTAAFGLARVNYTAQGIDGKPFQMNLRLPGQVYDAESGLHYNYLRDYDPTLGRYLTPDPMGIGGGTNPYAYVSNNPLTSTDPLGLYEEDVHYYMTYFLARAAGVDARIAYIIATGAQYIDDNPATRPLDPNYFTSTWELVFNNADARNRLESYHFTQQSKDDISSDPETRFRNPGNPQLISLFNAALHAGEVGSICAKAQMYGEYLHAFEDTFSHRKLDNTPIAVKLGLGHATSFHYPDYTYNTDLRWTDPNTGFTSGPYWPYNEDRTLEMEHEVFDHLASTWADGKSPAKTWEEIEPILVGAHGFNAIQENSANTHNFDSSIAGYTRKIDILNTQLNAWGYRFVDINGKETKLNLRQKTKGQYDPTEAAENRENFLRYSKNEYGHKNGEKFKQDEFKGTILK